MRHSLTDVLFHNDEDDDSVYGFKPNWVGWLMTICTLLFVRGCAVDFFQDDKSSLQLRELQSQISQIDDQARQRDVEISQQAVELDAELSQEFSQAFRDASEPSKEQTELKNEIAKSPWEECNHPSIFDRHRG